MPKIIRWHSCTSSHGGVLITAARKSKAEGQNICRIGDILACPKHGPNPVVEGSPDSLCEGPKIARHGDHTACGASLVSTATKTVVN